MNFLLLALSAAQLVFMFNVTQSIGYYGLIVPAMVITAIVWLVAFVRIIRG